jgi:hypothetical protein
MRDGRRIECAIIVGWSLGCSRSAATHGELGYPSALSPYYELTSNVGYERKVESTTRNDDRER